MTTSLRCLGLCARWFLGAPSRAVSRGAVWCALAAMSCGTLPPSPPPVEPAPTAAVDPRLQPTFSPASVATPETRRDRQTTERREILDAVWRTVRDQHYDPRLGGLDWGAVRRRYEPLALAAPGDEAFYRTLNDMIGELGQSHMMVTGPGADEDAEPTAEAATASPGTSSPGSGKPANATVEAAPYPAAQSPSRTNMGAVGQHDSVPALASPGPSAPGTPMAVTGIGDPGLTIRAIEGRPTVTAVRLGSSAQRHQLAPGFIVSRIGGRALSTTSAGKRALRPVEERFALRRSALHLLQGPPGTKVTIEYRDNQDRPGQAILERDPASGPVRQIGHLPPLQPTTHISEIGGVGIIAFNMFLLDPLLPEIQQAVDRFRAARIKGVILDLRGNPGGIGAMAIPVASEFVAAPTVLGTMQFREFSQTFTAKASLRRTPYTGPLVILTDEGTASASEILAAGLQESGRARVVGDSTLGAVLPSIVEALPHGAVMQMVVADFKTPKGIMVEGRGIQPDRRVLETRAAFRAGRDPVMDAALSELKVPEAHKRP